MLKVQVVFALARHQEVIDLQLQAGATVADAVRASGILQRHPRIDVARHGCGIFGRRCAPEQSLSDGDRVEIYRPLAADAKEARRRRAARTRANRLSPGEKDAN